MCIRDRSIIDLLNRGNPDLKEIKSGGHDNIGHVWTHTTAYGDLDNNGTIDLYIPFNIVDRTEECSTSPAGCHNYTLLNDGYGNFTLGSVGKRQFSGDIDVALNLKPEELPAFIEKLKKNPLIKDIAKSSVIMTKVQIQNFDKSKSDGRPRTGFVQLDFMPGDPGWLKTYFHSPAEKESKYKGVFRNVMVATMAAVHNRDDSDAETEDGRPLESRRLMWSPTDGLVRVLRTPVPRKDGNGYTAKNQNKIIDGPWKQADEIAKQLGLNSTKDLNSFESLLDAMKKNYTCLLYTSPSPRDRRGSGMPSSA